MQGWEKDTQRIMTLNNNNEPKCSSAQGLLSPYSFSIDCYDNIYTLPTVASIKPAGQDVAGLVTELISEPGVCTPLITVRDTVYSSAKVPGLDNAQAPGSPASGTVATSSTVTCRRRGQRQNLACFTMLKKAPNFFTAFSRWMPES